MSVTVTVIRWQPADCVSDCDCTNLCRYHGGNISRWHRCLSRYGVRWTTNTTHWSIFGLCELSDTSTRRKFDTKNAWIAWQKSISFRARCLVLATLWYRWECPLTSLLRKVRSLWSKYHPHTFLFSFFIIFNFLDFQNAAILDHYWIMRNEKQLTVLIQDSYNKTVHNDQYSPRFRQFKPLLWPRALRDWLWYMYMTTTPLSRHVYFFNKCATDWHAKLTHDE